MITNPRKIFYTTTFDQYNGVFLKIMPLSRDIGRYFDTIGQSNTGNLS
jgi:hypothetical protein